ncbi:hypothetical protein FACS1894208_05830 [Clostridia bacterium]|nr:hypothetical protein FACS1894208_05830 [Clostridia bacterium]
MFKHVTGRFTTARGFATGLVAGIMLTTTVTTALAAAPIKEALVGFYNDITIYVNGAFFQSSVKDAKGEPVYPIIYEGRTYLPIAAIAEAFDVPVAWEGTTRSIYLGTKPGETRYMTDTCPAYENKGDMYYKEYSALKTPTQSFVMGGVKYNNGMVFDYTPSWATYNLNGNYSSFNALVGHIDGANMVDYTLYVYYDGVVAKTIDIKSDSLPKEITLDVKGVLQLKFALEWTNEVHINSTYGIANPVLR